MKLIRVYPLLYYCIFCTSISADSISLFSGKQIKNVKVTLRKRSVLVNYTNGSTEEFNSKDIKTTRFSPVIYQKLSQQNVAQKPEKNKFLRVIKKSIRFIKTRVASTFRKVAKTIGFDKKDASEEIQE